MTVDALHSDLRGNRRTILWAYGSPVDLVASSTGRNRREGEVGTARSKVMTAVGQRTGPISEANILQAVIRFPKDGL
jgi:hypothetical protein